MWNSFQRNNLTNQFPKEEERKKYKDCVLIKKTAEGYQFEDTFRRLLLANPEFVKMIDELIAYGIDKLAEKYECAEYRRVFL